MSERLSMLALPRSSSWQTPQLCYPMGSCQDKSVLLCDCKLPFQNDRLAGPVLRDT